MQDQVLIVDDEPGLRNALADVLTREGYAVQEASNAGEALEEIDRHLPHLVFCDWKMAGGDGRSFLVEMRERDLLRDLPVVIMTAHGTSHNAIESMQLGAYDFISKPLDLDEVIHTAKRATQHARLQREVRDLKQRLQVSDTGEDHEIVGHSKPMLDVFKAVGRVAATDTSVLLQGESGTGKELIARSIHRHSARRDAAFIVVNCAALPAELLESELFGHEKGAFTGALARKAGRFEAADGGTIFLDEIGELPLSLQPKLLRVLQERSFERVGSNDTVNADFRLIAATNRDLEAESKADRFRQDLYYRLAAFTIEIPPLRSRRADIVPLAEYFLGVYSEQNNFPVSGFSDDGVLALQHYSYPGNVRELEHMVESAVLMAGGRIITPEHLWPKHADQDDLASEKLMELPFHQSVEAWERGLIIAALRRADGNKAEAARALGIHRRLLYEKLKQFNLD